MQETKRMDLRQLEDVMEEPKGGMVENKGTLISDHIQNKPQLDSGSALQTFFDSITISSIPGIKNSSELQVLELNAGDRVRDAIQLLFEKNVSGAPIADPLDNETTPGRFADRYIGFIDFASIVLWSLEKCEKSQIQSVGNGGNETGRTSFFTLLDQNPQVGQTKIGELAKSFLWDPFFPVRLDDSLLHVLLLLSKHRRQVLPVIEQPNSQIIGFLTQNAVLELLLQQSSGLEWFDKIADTTLSEFRLENEDQVAQVYGNQSTAEALQILSENRVTAIAVVNQDTKKLIGTARKSDIYLLLENDKLIHNRKSLTMEEFIHKETGARDKGPTIERDIGALISAGALRLRHSFLQRMDRPVTNKKTDTLRQAMKNLAETKGGFSFLIDDSEQIRGVLTIRDIIIQFAPPSIDSSIHGGGFFESALEQTGCQVKNGILVRNH